MASVALREAVYRSLVGSAELDLLGWPPASIYPAMSPESPQERVFMVLRWGPTTPGVGPANTGDLGLWCYDREPRYDRIEQALTAARGILALLVGARMALGGAVLGVDWQGAGPDLYDDVYAASVRYESYRVTASGN